MDNYKDIVVLILIGPDASNLKPVGTGYPIARDRILTARHLFDEMVPGTHIWVRWRTEIEVSPEPRLAQLIWTDSSEPNEARLDVAILETKFPDKALSKKFGQLSVRYPKDNEKWASDGYGIAGNKADGTPETVGMIGEIMSAPSGKTVFGLGAKYKTSLPNGWKGLSGSPVFVENTILGVIVSRPDEFENERLWAAPIWKLLNDQGFNIAAGRLFDREKYERFCQNVMASLPETLEKAPVFKCALQQKFGLGEIDVLNLSKYITNMSSGEFICAVHEICQSWDNDGWPSEDLKEIIGNFVLRIMPILLDKEILVWIHDQDASKKFDSAFVIATLHMAEIAMACFDGRAVTYEMRKNINNSNLVPEPVFSIPKPPPEKLVNDCSELVPHIHRELYNIGCRDNYGEGWSDEAKLEMVNEFLENSKKGRKTRYYSFWPGEFGSSDTARSIMKKLSDISPNLSLIPQHRDPARRRIEALTIDNFSYFVGLATKANGFQ